MAGSSLGISEVKLASGDSAYARIRGFVYENWERGQATPDISQRQDIDILITRLPFAIGRTRQEETDETEPYIKVPNDPIHWLVVENGKVSKKHAVIFHKPGTTELRLRCYGRNGVDFNESHLDADGEVILTQRSCFRAGPLYCYILLPLVNQPAPSGAGAPISKPVKPRIKASQYRTILDSLYASHFSAIGGYFTLQDVCILARSEMKDVPFSDDERIIRAAFKKRLEKPLSGYEEVAQKDVPQDILSRKSQHGTISKSMHGAQWYKRSSIKPAEPAEGEEDGDDE
jgi:hypothetical protein